MINNINFKHYKQYIHIIPINIKKEPNYSWYLRDYLKDDYIEGLTTHMTNFEWVEFGDVFTLEKGKIASSKIEYDENGLFNVISLSETNKKTHIIKDINTINGENVFISNMPAGNWKCKIKYYNGECYWTNLMSKLIINKKYIKNINIKFIYYYLQTIKEHIDNIYIRGTCNPSLDQKNFNRIKLPLPSIEDQEKIIQNIMELEESKRDINKGIEGNNKMRKMYMEAMIKCATNREINKIMKLGDMCEIYNGKNITEKQFIDGEYPVIGGGKNYIGYHNEFNAPENTITISKDGSCGIIIKHKQKIFVSNHGFYINYINTNIVTNNYFYNYLLLIENVLSSYGKGASQQGIIKNDILTKVKIPIPPLEYQNKMDETLNNFDELDEGFNNMLQEIEKNVKTAFLNSLDDFGNPNGFNIDKLISE